jgi:hypothetical protein
MRIVRQAAYVGRNAAKLLQRCLGRMRISGVYMGRKVR